MALFIKNYLCFTPVLFCLMSTQHSMALTNNPHQLTEKQLLRIIDEEVLKMSDDPKNLEWTENYGVQPIDGYELDYSEKCAFIASTLNKKARAACSVILKITAQNSTTYKAQWS